MVSQQLQIYTRFIRPHSATIALVTPVVLYGLHIYQNYCEKVDAILRTFAEQGHATSCINDHSKPGHYACQVAQQRDMSVTIMLQ